MEFPKQDSSAKRKDFQNCQKKQKCSSVRQLWVASDARLYFLAFETREQANFLSIKHVKNSNPSLMVTPIRVTFRSQHTYDPPGIFSSSFSHSFWKVSTTCLELSSFLMSHTSANVSVRLYPRTTTLKCERCPRIKKLSPPKSCIAQIIISLAFLLHFAHCNRFCFASKSFRCRHQKWAWLTLDSTPVCWTLVGGWIGQNPTMFPGKRTMSTIFIDICERNAWTMNRSPPKANTKFAFCPNVTQSMILNAPKCSGQRCAIEWLQFVRTGFKYSRCKPTEEESWQKTGWVTRARILEKNKHQRALNETLNVRSKWKQIVQNDWNCYPFLVRFSCEFVLHFSIGDQQWGSLIAQVSSSPCSGTRQCWLVCKRIGQKLQHQQPKVREESTELECAFNPILEWTKSWEQSEHVHCSFFCIVVVRHWWKA